MPSVPHPELASIDHDAALIPYFRVGETIEGRFGASTGLDTLPIGEQVLTKFNAALFATFVGRKAQGAAGAKLTRVAQGLVLKVWDEGPPIPDIAVPVSGTLRTQPTNDVFLVARGSPGAPVSPSAYSAAMAQTRATVELGTLKTPAGATLPAYVSRNIAASYTGAVAHAVMQDLTRLGLLADAETAVDPAPEPSWLDSAFAASGQLSAAVSASTVMRVAFGDRAGHRVRRIGRGFGSEDDEPVTKGPRCVSVNGFTGPKPFVCRRPSLLRSSSPWCHPRAGI